jgi:hypothetical protein
VQYKTSGKSYAHDFYPKLLNHAFMPKPDFEGYGNNIKKTYEYYHEQYPLGVYEHQMPDHPSTFMKIVKGSSQAISAANDERRQIIWDGSIGRFELFRNHVEGHHQKIGSGYLFDKEFQKAYLEKEVVCYVVLRNKVPSALNLRKMHAHWMAHYSVLVKL